MSTVVLSLFGDEIIPEQINAVGKSRAARKPKVEAKKEEIVPEIRPALPEVVQEEKAAVGDPITDEDIAVAPEVAIEITPDIRQEIQLPVVEVLPIEVKAAPESFEVVPEVNREHVPPPVEIAPAMTQVAPTVQTPKKAVPAKPKPAVKKAKPAAKKTVKKELVKKEKPEGRPILEGWVPDKQYYSIGEVAGLFFVATSHIRFWTNEFALKVRTTRKGDRLYSPEQIGELRTIYHLVKEKGYTIAGAKARLKDAKKAPVHTLDLKQSLLQLRNKLVEIKNQL